MSKLTPRQRTVLSIVCRETRKGNHTWYRAADHGERVTLASLYYRGLLVRRAWKQAKHPENNANEYRPAPAVEQCLQELLDENHNR